MRKNTFITGLFMLFLVTAAEARPTDWCNPVVEISRAPSSIGRLLVELAEQYNFNLTFPTSLDSPVQIDDSMKLNQMVVMLTKGMSTILRHENVDDCDSLRLSEISVLPAGEDSDYLDVIRVRNSDYDNYFYIDDMEQYVTEVLLRERKANVKKMTPEQRVEFKFFRKRLSRELDDEIQERKNKNKKNSKDIKKSKNED